jgi:hypothetical protein
MSRSCEEQCHPRDNASNYDFCDSVTYALNQSIINRHLLYKLSLHVMLSLKVIFRELEGGKFLLQKRGYCLMDLQKLDDSSAASAAFRSCNLASSSPSYQTPSVCNSGLRDAALHFHILRYFTSPPTKSIKVLQIKVCKLNFIHYQESGHKCESL